MPTPLKPDPLGLESNQPFKGPVSTRNIAKLNPLPYTEQEQTETEDDYDDQQRRLLEEEFDKEYDYPSQEEEYYGRTEHSAENEPAEITDIEDEVSGDVDEPYSTTIPQQAKLPQRGKKRSIEERESYGTTMPQAEELSRKRRMGEEVEEEEGEVNDDGDHNQSQVSST